jgi:hypothetical protein
MKNLLCSLAILTLSLPSLLAREGAFSSVIIRETDKPFQLTLTSRQWIKITNFTQNLKPETPAAVAVYQGTGDGLWVLVADQPTTTHVAHDDVFIAGPAIVSVPAIPGATVFLTYLRGSD